MSRTRLMSALVAAVFAMGVGSAARADDAKCQDAVAKGSRNVGNQEQKKNRKCVKDGAGDVDTCVDTESPKAATKETKLVDLFASGGKCDPLPAIGVNSSASDIATETEKSSGDILRKVFGDPVDGINAGSKCQDKIAKRAGKKFDTQLKAFRACVKGGAPLANQAAVDACITAGVNDAKAQSTVQPKLAADVTAQCDFSGGTAAEGMDDGSCAACTDGATCAACIGDVVDCEACEAMNNSSNSNFDCDTLDDGALNGSCAAPVVCPLVSGTYTTTQVAGGTLQVYSFAPFAFPVGGTIKQEVGSGNSSCVHDTVVPATGGFVAPNFCVQALMFSTSVTQTGCGVGKIDSDGGSDFTVTSVADTSDSSATCNLPNVPCTGGTNTGARVDITVGNGAADTCPSGGTANALVSIPVHTVSWVDQSMGTFMGCQGNGVFGDDEDSMDIAAEFDQILDFTTDATTGSWSDIDGDTCSIAGFGPAAGFAATTAETTCINIGAQTVTVAAVGEFGADGGLNDGTFKTVLPSTLSGPVANSGATCASPPVINFGGTATRCIP